MGVWQLLNGMTYWIGVIIRYNNDEDCKVGYSERDQTSTSVFEEEV